MLHAQFFKFILGLDAPHVASLTDKKAELVNFLINHLAREEYK